VAIGALHAPFSTAILTGLFTTAQPASLMQLAGRALSYPCSTEDRIEHLRHPSHISGWPSIDNVLAPNGMHFSGLWPENVVYKSR
jgi:hypothetical protein